MNFYESICLAKIFSIAMGYTPKSSITDQEIDVAVECLKKTADQKQNWTEETKQMYKTMAELCGELSKHEKNQ